MEQETITREQFDERLDAANARLHAEREALEAQNADLKQLTARYNSLMETTTNTLLDDPVYLDMIRRGVAIYNERLKAILEPAHNGKAVAINVENGEYIIADDPPEARRLFHEKYGTPNGISMTIGPETDLLMLARAMVGRKPIRIQP